MFPDVEAWTEGVHYQGDVVMHAGGTWQATRDTALEPSRLHERDWRLLAAPGRDARSPVVRGTWRNTETYGELEIVAANGSAYISRRPNPGPCPGDDWQLIASAGKRGDRGEKGPRGERGQAGEVGPSGVTIIAWRVNRGAYTATPVMSDGTDGPALELRDLFEQFQIEAA
jgi:hypothetical protein